MKLSKLERLYLSNQLKIIEKLYPEEADYYAEQRKALEEGYELHYSWLFEHLYDGMSEEECKNVLDILDMYRSFYFAEKRGSLPAEITSNAWFTFQGFDGNYETKQMGYCRYFILDLGRFEELKNNQPFPDFNSHHPTLDKYAAMVKCWKECVNKFEPSAEEIKKILKSK